MSWLWPSKDEIRQSEQELTTFMVARARQRQRDKLAAVALQGLLAGGARGQRTEIAAEAYAMADAMMEVDQTTPAGGGP